VSGIGFWQLDAQAAKIVVERLEFAQRIRVLGAADLAADFFSESHARRLTGVLECGKIVRDSSANDARQRFSSPKRDFVRQSMEV
jgi:hypothetical protein